jgi:type I restriction enzyme M protein
MITGNIKSQIDRWSDGIGKDGGRPYDDLRWSRFKHFAPADMRTVVAEHVFPFLRTLGGDGSTYLDAVPMEDRDTKGDVYEYMLGKIASAGQNGQFLTPRHIMLFASLQHRAFRGELS